MNFPIAFWRVYVGIIADNKRGQDSNLNRFPRSLTHRALTLSNL